MVSQRERLLIIGIALVALLCVDSALLPGKSQVGWIYHQSGFYFIFATFFFWIFLLWPRNVNRSQAISVVREFGWVFLLIIFLVAAMFMASPMKFRILADETNLLGVAAAMYDSHSFFNQTQGLYYYGSFHEVHHVWEIRPVFFPFLVYLLHTLTGYSAYNGFMVNAVAGALALWCFYWLLTRFFNRWLALAGMISLAAYPVFVLWVTSSGFEIVNLLMALVAFCFLYRFLHSGDTFEMERMVVTLALLAQTRYESVLFFAGFFLALFFVFKREYLQKLSWRCLFWPVLFVPVLWQRVLKTSKSDYQVYGDSPVFSIDHFWKHLHKAQEYFFAYEDRYGIIGPVSWLAIIGLVIGCYLLYKKRGCLSVELKGMLLAVLLSYLMLSVAVLSYYWGDLTVSFAIRLGIIFIPLIILLALVAVDFLLRSYKSAAIPVLVATAALLFFYWPIAGKNEAVGQLKIYRHYQTALAYLEENFPGRNIVIVTDRPGMYSVHRWGAVSFDYANKNARRLKSELQRKLYSDILVIQQISLADGSGKDGLKLDDVFIQHGIYESQTEARFRLRISRVTIADVLGSVDSAGETRQSPE